ncbi:hypothetical protein RGAI101_3757 [Roseobacter sp. GAI101]|nr:hypothetical protein RGAI101_3757 [Roseobacter sp. GAI101]
MHVFAASRLENTSQAATKKLRAKVLFGAFVMLAYSSRKVLRP